MEISSLGFIGAGNMNTAILKGVLKAGLIPRENIWVSNRHREKLEQFMGSGIHTTLDNSEVVRNTYAVILGVKPQMFSDVLPGIVPYTKGKCVISIAAGISSSFLRQALPGAKIVRVMPNTPLMVGCGATAVARSADVEDSLLEAVASLFRVSGEVAMIDESSMDDIINVNGSSPAWFFKMADIMVRRAVSVGIDGEVALRLTAKTMEGAARLLLESGKTPEELCRQVCSPGGTTLASLSAFDDYHFEELMLEAMERCTKRSKELGM